MTAGFRLLRPVASSRVYAVLLPIRPESDETRPFPQITKGGFSSGHSPGSRACTRTAPATVKSGFAQVAAVFYAL